MDDLKKQKIDMWKKKLSGYQKQLDETMQRRGEAAREGDLRENAAYQMASEDADMLRAQIENVKKILTDLGVDSAELEEKRPASAKASADEEG